MADHFRRAGAEVLLTTEKDALNLCDHCAELIAPLRLYALETRMTLEREEEFLGAIRAMSLQ